MFFFFSIVTVQLSKLCKNSKTYKLMMWLSFCMYAVHFSSVQMLSQVQLFATPWTTARQASLSIINSWSSSKPMSIELVMLSNHLILFHPHLLLPSIPPSIRVFSNEPALHMRWPNYWSFGFSISRTLEIHIPKKCDSWRQEMYLILSFYYLAPNLEYNKFQLP